MGNCTGGKPNPKESPKDKGPSANGQQKPAAPQVNNAPNPSPAHPHKKTDGTTVASREIAN